jgi:[FeFe] hydrogenase (group B1/B3)
MNTNSNTVHLRREVLVRLIRAYLSEDFEGTTDKIPYEMRPKNSEVPFRCCIHKERAILRSRTIASLGFAIEDDDEVTRLSDYAKRAEERTEIDKDVLTVVDTACQGCVPSRIYVTDLCQGCVARPCINSCAFGAISMVNGKSVIDGEKCKNCTKCIQVCPYHAIVKIRVPCEDACAVNAISKNEAGFAEIDFDKCISCGHCMSACPFGAIHEKSQMIDIIRAIKTGKKVVAMVAPSVVGQLPCSLGQLKTGFEKAGFAKMEEVAIGADLTAIHEAVDFKERIEKGDDFMTTSCCAAYKELVRKHIPEMTDFVSPTPTPMHFTAELVKKEDPDCVSVFVGPCVAKRFEGIHDDYVDYVMSFEEMGAMFVALKIELSELEEAEFDAPACAEGRRFGITGGVSASVVAANQSEHEVEPTIINGLNTQSLRQLKGYAKQRKCADGNLVEVMICEGGCVGGAGVLNSIKATTRKINTFCDDSEGLAENRDKYEQ